LQKKKKITNQRFLGIIGLFACGKYSQTCISVNPGL